MALIIITMASNLSEEEIMNAIGTIQRNSSLNGKK
jgi:hypothetical protein